MKKRMLSLMLAVLMVVCLLPTTALAATAGHTAADAIAWAQSQVGKSLDYDGVYGAQCVDLICCYYQYLGQRSPGGNGCDYATNRLPDGWQRIKGAQPQPGDILVYSGNSENPYGHVGIYESDYCTYNQNFNYEQYVQRVTIRYNHFSNPYWGVIRPDFSTAPLTATWEGPTAANITETGAHIISRVTFPQKVVFAQAGIRVYDESGKMVGTRDELDPITSPYLKFDYDINSELGISLQSGKKYSSSLYVIVNGKEYWSQPVTFTTAHTHYYTATVTAPTCTAKGYTTHTCACGNSYVDTYTDALGHAWDNGKVTKQPTEAETGVKTFTCTRCGETKTETIPKLAHEHSYKAVVTAPTCTEKGYTTHTCACGDSYVDTYTDALGHAWDNGKVTKEPTETEDGVKTFTCTRCGETKTETIPKLTHEHNYNAVVTAPTCTEKGYTTHTCACGDSYVDTYVDALGHAWDNGKVTKEPTETETGVKTFTCTRCGETKTETIPKLTHEHSYKAVVTAPTCTEKGYTTHTCACGDSYVDTYVDALGHAWDEGKVTKAATETETGVKTFTCTRCGETKTEVIPAGGCPSAGFTDVPGEDNWAHAGIDYCIANGLMSGIGNNLFGPKLTTTRAQIVQILYNLEGEPKVSGKTPFTDLTQDWYQGAILWAYQTGVVAGTSSTTFEPDLPVTREQIAVILMEYVTRVLKLERTWTPADLSAFPDAGSVSDWAKDAMADAVALGLISGASNGGQTYLEPQGSATREQVATILMEFCKNVKK